MLCILSSDHIFVMVLFVSPQPVLVISLEFHRSGLALGQSSLNRNAFPWLLSDLLLMTGTFVDINHWTSCSRGIGGTMVCSANTAL
jgi:hypothetical protein